MIREALASLARQESLGGVLTRTPVTRALVQRLVAGESVDDAIRAAATLTDAGRWVSLERAAPSADSLSAGAHVTADLEELVAAVAASGLSSACEVAVLVETLGPWGDAATRAEVDRRLRGFVDRASVHGIGVMVGSGAVEHHAATMHLVDALRSDGRSVGSTVPALLRSAERECKQRAGERVRVVKGGRRGGSPDAYLQPAEIDKSFVRCTRALLQGAGDPSFATHDPRLVAVVEDLAARYGRPRGSFEFAFYLGRLESTQERLVEEGHRVRVYVPYGPEWYGRLVGGLAEQPSSIASAIRSLLPGG